MEERAAAGTASVSAGIVEVDSLAERAAGAASEAARAADDLEAMAARLGTLVGDFRC